MTNLRRPVVNLPKFSAVMVTRIIFDQRASFCLKIARFLMKVKSSDVAVYLFDVIAPESRDNAA